MHTRHHWKRMAVIMAATAVMLFLGWPGHVFAQQATAAATAPMVIASEVLGHAHPVPIDIPELSLARVAIMPGAAIPVHHHPGTQIAAVVQGTLTYSVLTGTVMWYHASDPMGQPHEIASGQTVQVLSGDALVESPDSINQGRNERSVPVVIYLSTLFPEGAPRSIVESATPTP